MARLLRLSGSLIIILLCLASIRSSINMREKTLTTSAEDRNGLDIIYSIGSIAENWLYDTRTSRFYEHNRKSPNLVILDITEESLQKIGRWPWTRSKYATILDNLAAYGAKLAMFDVTFPEPEDNGADEVFAEAIQRFTKDDKHILVVGYDLSEDPQKALKPVPDDFLISAITGRAHQNVEPFYINKYGFIAPTLLKAMPRFGFLISSPDIDGIYRYARLAAQVDGSFYPSLGFAGFLAYYSNGQDRNVSVNALDNSPLYELSKTNADKTSTTLLSSLSELKVRYHGSENAFTRIPIHEIFFDKNPSRNEAMQKIFSGKAVLMGSSAAGANDLRHSPVDPAMPGMYMHANVFHALDQDYFYQAEEKSIWISLALFLAGATFVLLLSLLKSPLTETLGGILVAVVVFAADYFYFAPEGYFIRLFFCMAGIVFLNIWLTLINMFMEAREKKKIRDTFQRYVAPEIVKEMLANPESLKTGGQKREITMLFADVYDFTSISEALGPQELSNMLNIYMNRMTEILFTTQGTLDKYIGDALVGFWGAPLKLPNHAYLAVLGTKEMLEALPEVNKEFQRLKIPNINVGIGLNTGEVSVGNMGSDKIFQYTALGDNMNLASRLQGLTKHYGVNAIISEFTFEQLKDKHSEFCLRPLDIVQVKGKSRAVKIYELMPSWNPLFKEKALLEKYSDAYENKYLHREFGAAAAAFREILKVVPEDKACKLLLEHAETFIASPPDNTWVGVNVFTKK